MKILVTPTSFLKPDNERARLMLEAFADEIVYNELGRPLTADEVLERLPGVDGYVAGLDTIDAGVLEKAPDSLKVISRYGAGVDRVDLAAAAKRGIAVTNTPGTNAVAVCELAFGLMLAAARRIPQLDAAVRQGEWPRSQGLELCGRTLGIAGLGAIGKNLAVRAKAFGMRVAAYDPYMDERFAAEHGIETGPLEAVLKKADFLSLHVPLTDKTRHMIGAEAIASMPDGAVIINTARGGIIDEQAAADALRAGKLRAVCLDAFEQEPPQNSPLMGMDGVIMTPHTGAHTGEAVSAMGFMAVENLIQVLHGRPCAHIVHI
jgi:D-3-phosphoglycerate dehydrogenase